MNLCAFCQFHRTSASLVDGTPICWRPCYAALLKSQGGSNIARALVDAFAETGGRGLAARDYMEQRGWDSRATATRLIAYLLGVSPEAVAMLGDRATALPAGRP